MVWGTTLSAVPCRISSGAFTFSMRSEESKRWVTTIPMPGTQPHRMPRIRSGIDVNVASTITPVTWSGGNPLATSIASAPPRLWP